MRMGRAYSLLSSNKAVLNNMSFITLLHVFNLIAPLITYPYLVSVLTKDLYGVVLTAQVLVSYFSLIINFGFDEVGAKYVSENRNNPIKLSDIICSVFFVRLSLWVLCIFVYALIVFLVPAYKEHWLLFLLSYGLTFIDVLFPQYFYQGIEKMKYTTILNIGIKLLFILLIFIFVKGPSDYILVPFFYSIGYFFAGALSFLLIFRKMKIPFSLPGVKSMKCYMRDSSALLATNLIATIKDKLNVLLLGHFSGMGNVVIYDLGTRINSLTSKPVEILRITLFPKIAREKRIIYVKKILVLSLSISILTAILVNIFLPQIVNFFLHEQINLWPLRVFSLAPILLSVSVMIASNVFIAFGKNKYMLRSIIVTTLAYILLLAFMWSFGMLSNMYAFILIAVGSYAIELIYRLIVMRKIEKQL